MNDARFDHLARSLGDASRRSLLRLLAGAALIGALGTAFEDGSARKRCAKLKGKKKQQCLKKTRTSEDVPPPLPGDPCATVMCVDEGPSSCGTTGVCAAGTCLTYNPGTPCREASCSGGVETLAEECDGNGPCPLRQRNCGDAGCGPTTCKRGNGARCDVGDECVSTHCVGGFCCNQACVGEHASEPGFCDYGECILVCDSGWGNCDGPPPGACDTPLGTDTNCRHCGDRCPFDRFCAEGQCVPKFAQGAACTRHGECETEICVSGVCCDQVCVYGTCATGTCLPII